MLHKKLICRRCSRRIPHAGELREFRAALDANESNAAIRHEINLEYSRTYCTGHPHESTGVHHNPPLPDLDSYDKPIQHDRDATKGLGYPAREGGKYGSHP